jgi:hypothetical protein
MVLPRTAAARSGAVSTDFPGTLYHNCNLNLCSFPLSMRGQTDGHTHTRPSSYIFQVLWEDVIKLLMILSPEVLTAAGMQTAVFCLVGCSVVVEVC